MIGLVIASTELQKAVYTALSGSYTIYEVIPPNTPMPYITIGEEILKTSNTKTNIRTVHNITIHTWSQGTSSAESKVMNNFVMQTISNGLTVNGFNVDMISLGLLTTLKEEGSQGLSNSIFHGVLQFEITLSN